MKTYLISKEKENILYHIYEYDYETGCRKRIATNSSKDIGEIQEMTYDFISKFRYTRFDFDIITEDDLFIELL
jgi:hypothetical protein